MKCDRCGWEGKGDDGCGTHACNPPPSMFAQFASTIGFQSGHALAEARINALEAENASLRSQLAECQRQLEAERAIQRYGDRVGGRLEKIDGEWVIRPLTPDSPP